MRQSGAPAAGAAALVVCLLVWAAPAAGQVRPACAPEKTLGVKLTSQERELPSPLIATHDVSVEADFTGTTERETYAPPPGVKVLAAGRSGRRLHRPDRGAASRSPCRGSRRSIPRTRRVTPSDPLQSCAASTVVTLPIVAGAPEPRGQAAARGAPGCGWASRRSPWCRRSSSPTCRRWRSRPARPHARASRRRRPRRGRWPYRCAPSTRSSTPRRCPTPSTSAWPGAAGYYLLTCGAVFSEVARPFLDTDALQRGVEKADIDGGVKLLPAPSRASRPPATA